MSATDESVPLTYAYPYVNVSFGFHVAMTLANRPIASARQSKNMWMAVWEIFISLDRGAIVIKTLTIRDESQRIRPDSPQHLNKHVRQVEA